MEWNEVVEYLAGLDELQIAELEKEVADRREEIDEAIDKALDLLHQVDILLTNHNLILTNAGEPLEINYLEIKPDID